MFFPWMLVVSGPEMFPCFTSSLMFLTTSVIASISVHPILKQLIIPSFVFKTLPGGIECAKHKMLTCLPSLGPSHI